MIGYRLSWRVKVGQDKEEEQGQKERAGGVMNLRAICLYKWRSSGAYQPRSSLRKRNSPQHRRLAVPSLLLYRSFHECSRSHSKLPKHRTLKIIYMKACNGIQRFATSDKSNDRDKASPAKEAVRV